MSNANDWVRPSSSRLNYTYLQDFPEYDTGGPTQSLVDRRDRFDVLFEQNHVIDRLFRMLDRGSCGENRDLVLSEGAQREDKSPLTAVKTRSASTKALRASIGFSKYATVRKVFQVPCRTAKKMSSFRSSSLKAS